MALFIRQNDDRSKLQERLAAELQERAKQRAANDAGPDMVDDTEYMKDTKQTTSLAWVWISIIVISIAACVWLVVLNAKNV
jgi:hypothetical protein